MKAQYFAALHLAGATKDGGDIYINPATVAAVMAHVNPNQPDASEGTDILIDGAQVVYNVTERIDEVLHLLASSIGRLPK